MNMLVVFKFLVVIFCVSALAGNYYFGLKKKRLNSMGRCAKCGGEFENGVKLAYASFSEMHWYCKKCYEKSERFDRFLKWGVFVSVVTTTIILFLLVKFNS